MKGKIILVIVVCMGLFIASSVYAEGIDEFTKLMIHSDTFDGDTNFVDDSLTGHSISGNGGVAHTTTQYQFSASSIFFDGTDDYLAIPDSVDWTWGYGDFTVDFWVRFSSTGGYQGLLLSQVQTTQYFRSGFFNNYLRWDTYSIDYMWSWAPSIDTWYHVAFVRHSGIIRAYVNGNEIGSGQSDSVYYDATNGLYFGRDHDTYPGYNHFHGYIDELRISKGIARWTSDFTPPSAPYRDHLCGDGILDPGEQCDDGNNTDGDGCQADCLLPVCGDGILDPGEECDDGNTIDGDGCAADCTIERPAVPTLTEWGMIIFSILLAGTALIVMHRRRRAG